MVLLGHSTETLRTQDIKVTEDVTFESMLLSSPTLKGLTSSGFYRPSPVQLLGIPLGKCGFDLLIEAKSGTGKTAVFSVIALEQLDISKGLQVIILAPTREIAAQICDVLIQIGSNYEGLCVEVVIGGLSVQEDINKFKKKVHIVVGSPGRLRHLIQEKHIDISSVRLCILDEADKLMEKSYKPDINYIFTKLPIQKQVILSSATYPEECKLFISKYVKNSQHVCPDSNSILIGISQYITVVEHNTNIVRMTQSRYQELLKLLSEKQFKQCLIFCNYQARVSELHKMLSRDKWPTEQLYGQQQQEDRLTALKTLQEYKCRVLISTDLAARGIDASNVDLVINFEPPYEWQTYLHRIGRAGRYGSFGTAITILCEGKETSDFKEMVDTLKIPLYDNIWDEKNIPIKENYNIYSDKIKEKSSKVLNHDFTELWNALCSKTSITQLETFETLCTSLENNDPVKIYTFSDLVSSFKNSIKINDDSIYRNIAADNLPFQKYFADTTENMFEQFFRDPESIQENNYVNISPLENNLPLKENATVLNNLDIRNDLNIQYNKDLLQAGLPSTFCSKTDEFKPKKVNHHKKRHHLKRSKSSSSVELFNDSSKSPNNFGTLKEEGDTIPYISSQTMSKDMAMNVTAGSSLHSKRINAESKYLLWFNQLKTQIQQLQYMMYIEEITSY